jgi:hypothetical protein
MILRLTGVPSQRNLIAIAAMAAELSGRPAWQPDCVAHAFDSDELVNTRVAEGRVASKI